jgi:hypothetical protein
VLEFEYLGSDLEVAVVVQDRHPEFSCQHGGRQAGDAVRSMSPGQSKTRCAANARSHWSAAGEAAVRTRSRPRLHDAATAPGPLAGRRASGGIRPMVGVESAHVRCHDRPATVDADISAPGGAVRTVVVTARGDLEIRRQVLDLLHAAGGGR